MPGDDESPTPAEPASADDMDTDTAAAFIERFVDERGLETLEAFVDPDELAQVGSGLMPLADAVDALGEQRALELGRAAAEGVPPAPSTAPKYVREGLLRQDADTLRALASWAAALADHREQEAARELEAAAEQAADETPAEWTDRSDEWADELEEAREKAELASDTGTLTTKTIDGRDYYYLQWREGDTVRSQYVAPVVPADDS